MQASFPPDTWYFFLQQNGTDGNDGKFLEDEAKAWHHARLREPTLNKARVKQEREQLYSYIYITYIYYIYIYYIYIYIIYIYITYIYIYILHIYITYIYILHIYILHIYVTYIYIYYIYIYITYIYILHIYILHIYIYYIYIYITYIYILHIYMVYQCKSLDLANLIPREAHDVVKSMSRFFAMRHDVPGREIEQPRHMVSTCLQVRYRRNTGAHVKTARCSSTL